VLCFDQRYPTQTPFLRGTGGRHIAQKARGDKQKKKKSLKDLSRVMPGKYPWSTATGLWYTFFMKVYLDADGAPWRDLVIERARRHEVTVVVVADYSHVLSVGDDVEQIVVDDGRDAADYAIVNRVQEGDLVITQDVGLASLIIPKGAVAISPRGFEFTAGSLEGRLIRRWFNGKVRMAGGRIKGPPRFTPEDRDRFLALLENKIITATKET
jgi:uncharacterized protein YaiI (UPF0178 family)